MQNVITWVSILPFRLYPLASARRDVAREKLNPSAPHIDNLAQKKACSSLTFQPSRVRYMKEVVIKTAESTDSGNRFVVAAISLNNDCILGSFIIK